MLWVHRVNPAVNIENCVFMHAFDVALQYEGNATFQTSPIISGNHFESAKTAIYFSDSAPVFQNNLIRSNDWSFARGDKAHPTYSGNQLNGNRYGGIRVGGTLSQDQLWGLFQGSVMPYYVTSDITVNAGATLTIEPGVIVKFAAVDTGSAYNTWYPRRRMVVNGVLNAQGQPGNPIIFTSDRDDDHGGDTNGDGIYGPDSPNSSRPAAGNWGYVRINGAGSTLRHCEFWYGGLGSHNTFGNNFSEPYMLWVTAAQAEITRCYFRHAFNIAVRYDSSAPFASLNLVNNQFQNCPIGLSYHGSTAEQSNSRVLGNSFSAGQVGIDVTRAGVTMLVRGNQFSSLSQFGIRSTETAGTVTAQANWWGHLSGPGGSGAGSGVPVSDHVTYSGWWSSPNEPNHGVFNVVASRQGDSMLVDVTYDLLGEEDATYHVSFDASRTGGAPYTIHPGQHALSGDVGPGIEPGFDRHILWNAAVGGSPFTELMRVRITANVE